MEGRRGEKTRKVKLYDNEARREMDDEVTDRTIDFIQRSAKTGKPFFVVRAIHPATHADRGVEGVRGQDRQRPFADMLAEMDYNSGRILDAVSALKIQNNTIVIFTATTAPRTPFHGAVGLGPGVALM